MAHLLQSQLVSDLGMVDVDQGVVFPLAELGRQPVGPDAHLEPDVRPGGGQRRELQFGL